ncbi:hypothetical protein BJV74DRAFT_264431 [Russula compacta]|nr:hypothetical protein BJV74DRAFT_264431 [Russula compacta]
MSRPAWLVTLLSSARCRSWDIKIYLLLVLPKWLQHIYCSCETVTLAPLAKFLYKSKNRKYCKTLGVISIRIDGATTTPFALVLFAFHMENKQQESPGNSRHFGIITGGAPHRTGPQSPKVRSDRMTFVEQRHVLASSPPSSSGNVQWPRRVFVPVLPPPPPNCPTKSLGNSLHHVARRSTLGCALRRVLRVCQDHNTKKRNGK